MEILALLLFTFSSTITPGPNNIMMFSSGLNYGIKRSLPHLFGIFIGFPAMVVAVGLGIGFLFERFPVLHLILKIVGSLYLLYLAYKIATTRASIEERESSKPFTFLQAALFQWVNPKAWVLALTSVATFTALNGNYILAVAIIAAAFLLASLPCVGFWLCSGHVARNFVKSNLALMMFNWVMAFLLVLSLFPVFKELGLLMLGH
ncbi:LysE family translocator [Aurantivibrio infirmus]